MHNDIKQCFCGSHVNCGSCSHARIQYSVVFLRSGKFKGRNAYMCSDVAASSSTGSGDFVCSFRKVKYYVLLLFFPLPSLMASILDLSVTIATILPFGACYVIIHEVHSFHFFFSALEKEYRLLTHFCFCITGVRWKHRQRQRCYSHTGTANHSSVCPNKP